MIVFSHTQTLKTLNATNAQKRKAAPSTKIFLCTTAITQKKASVKTVGTVSTVLLQWFCRRRSLSSMSISTAK
jgi:hypothetical protein